MFQCSVAGAPKAAASKPKPGESAPRVQNPCYYKNSNRWGVKVGTKEVVSAPGLFVSVVILILMRILFSKG